VTIFVSYARRDHGLDALQGIEERVLRYGRPYIDDLHHHRHGANRHDAVEAALRSATAFVAVLTPYYLHTPWTCKEFLLACHRGIPILVLLPNGTFAPLTRIGVNSRPFRKDNLKVASSSSDQQRRRMPEADTNHLRE
jgi:hypothetical protein